MLALALTAVLHVAGSPAPSAANLATKTWLSQAPSDAPVVGPVKSIFELNHELQELEHDRPGLGFPIAFIAIGGAGLVLDGLLFLTFYVFSYGSLGGLYYYWPVLVVIGVAALVGFAGVGFLMLGIRLAQRANYDKRINEIKDELARRGNEHPYGLQPGNDLPPPPPPPPPPTGMIEVPQPQFALFVF